MVLRSATVWQVGSSTSRFSRMYSPLSFSAPSPNEVVRLLKAGSAPITCLLRAIGLNRQHETGSRRLAIEMNGASTADTVFTTHMGARQPQPIAEYVRDAKTVLVSPDGPLNRLPLGALPGKEPGTRLLEEVSVAVPV